MKVPGALVHVYVSRNHGNPWFLAGSTIIPSAQAVVGLTTALRVGDWIAAAQMLCGTHTAIAEPVTAVAPPPKTPVVTSPANGATGVPKRPQFTWTDPGTGTVAAATSYDVQVLDGSTVVIAPVSVTAKSFTPASDLTSQRTLTFQVRGKNASGAGAWGQAVFTTQALPLPVAPHLAAYDKATKKLTGSGLLPGKPVHVRISMLGNTVSNSYGGYVPDTRDAFGTFHANNSGGLDTVVDPIQVLQPLVLDDIAFLYGVAPGEVMHISANDGRPNAADTTGTLWSNTLAVTA